MDKKFLFGVLIGNMMAIGVLGGKAGLLAVAMTVAVAVVLFGAICIWLSITEEKK